MSTDIRGLLDKALEKPAISAPIVLVVLLAIGFYSWSAICPCDRMPGAVLFGAEHEEPVSDWTFANQVTLCQIQIRAGLLPHAINLNCFATESGDLYLSCSNCDGKRWSGFAVEDGTAWLRLDGTVYPVMLTRAMDPDEARHGLGRQTRQAALAGGAGQPAGTARQSPAGRLVVVPGRVAELMSCRRSSLTLLKVTTCRSPARRMSLGSP